MIPTLLMINWINLRRDYVALGLTFVLPIIFFSIFASIFSGATYQDILDFSVRNIGASGLACFSNPGHWLDSRLKGETSRRYTQLSRWAGRGEGFPGGLFVIDHSVDSHSR